MYFAETLVCMYVPTSWLSQALPSRMQLLHAHAAARTLLTVTSTRDPTHCWICLFCDADILLRMLRPAVRVVGDSHVVVDVLDT
jgi:hypothetical protein